MSTIYKKAFRGGFPCHLVCVLGREGVGKVFFPRENIRISCHPERGWLVVGGRLFDIEFRLYVEEKGKLFKNFHFPPSIHFFWFSCRFPFCATVPRGLLHNRRRKSISPFFSLSGSCLENDEIQSLLSRPSAAIGLLLLSRGMASYKVPHQVHCRTFLSVWQKSSGLQNKSTRTSFSPFFYG